MNTNKKFSSVAETLSGYLMELPPDKQAELLSQWTWQTAELEHNKRLTLQCTMLSGLLGLLGVCLGVMLTKCLQ